MEFYWKILLIPNPQEHILINQTKGLNKLYNNKIEYVFVLFNVIKENDSSHVNYINNKLWTYKVVSETEAEYEILIDNDDFTK